MCLEAHADNYEIVAKFGEALESVYDARYLNAAPALSVNAGARVARPLDGCTVRAYTSRTTCRVIYC